MKDADSSKVSDLAKKRGLQQLGTLGAGNHFLEVQRITDIFDRIKEKKRSKIIPVGFVVGKKNIYLTTNNGRLIIIDILTGKSSSVLKIDNEKISRPFILDKNLFIIKDNAIIKIN